MYEFINIVKALADPQRVRALVALQGRELCVCQIIELLELAPSTVSKHMWVLRQARLVDSRKQGRWMYYRLAETETSAQAREAVEWTIRSLSATKERFLLSSITWTSFGRLLPRQRTSRSTSSL